MKKFTDKVIKESVENEQFDPKELEMGVKIESEHNDIYNELKEWSSDVKLPWSETEFYEKIAKAHLREIPDYYSRLKIMEGGSV